MYQQMKQLIIVKSIEHQKILLNEDMQSQYVFDFYRNLFELSCNRLLVQHKTMINPANRDIIHHLLMYECNPTAVFDDNNLPEGLCDQMYELMPCVSNIATGWAVGGDAVSLCSSFFIHERSCLNRL